MSIALRYLGSDLASIAMRVWPSNFLQKILGSTPAVEGCGVPRLCRSQMLQSERAFSEIFLCVLWVIFITISAGPVGGSSPSDGPTFAHEFAVPNFVSPRSMKQSVSVSR